MMVLGHVSTPVSDTPGKVQTGLLQVGLKACLPCDATTLGTDMRRSVFMDPLVGGHGTRVRQHHGRWALCTRLKQEKIKIKNSDPQHFVTAGISKKQNKRLTELGAPLICWKWVTSSVLPENCVWHSGHLKLLYCSPSAFLQGRGISAWGPWGARRTGRGWDAAGAEASFIGLELTETAGPPVVVEGEETGGEEDEEESRPGQPQVEIRRNKWQMVNGDESQMNDACFLFLMKYYLTN